MGVSVCLSCLVKILPSIADDSPRTIHHVCHVCRGYGGASTIRRREKRRREPKAKKFLRVMCTAGAAPNSAVSSEYIPGRVKNRAHTLRWKRCTLPFRCRTGRPTVSQRGTAQH
ncbi:hypothetical protein EDD21DRAFT_225598 [Dissophora ornata]|nr:hypothetical protein EDD21DRAFT_225598 [Dissophora ornata]